MSEYLIVVKPKRPTLSPGDFHGSMVSDNPITTYIIEAFNREEALDGTTCPPGATLYVADMTDVATYEVPEKPKPVRVDL